MARKLFWLFVTNNFLRPQSLRNATAPRSRAAAFSSSVEGKGYAIQYLFASRRGKSATDHGSTRRQDTGKQRIDKPTAAGQQEP